jgi:hypothetical protein
MPAPAHSPGPVGFWTHHLRVVISTVAAVAARAGCSQPGRPISGV